MRVRWTLPALSHLDEIQDFVALDSPAAAHRLINDLMDRAELLLSQKTRSSESAVVFRERENW
jgi:toxin ParE1/3/4